MTSDATGPLTDEELTYCLTLADEFEELIGDSPRPTVVLYQSDVLHLIKAIRSTAPDLRTSRAEVKELRAKLADANWPTLHAECDARYERLRTDYDRLLRSTGRYSVEDRTS